MACSFSLRPFVGISFACLGLSGCLLSGFGGGASGGGEPGSGDTEVVDLEACKGDADAFEVEDNLVIKDDYNSSLHELVACGGMSVQLCASVTFAILNSIATNNPDATPAGWTYLGEGVYHTETTEVKMDSRFYLAHDFEFGKAGEPVNHNLFVGTNYLQGYNAYISGDELVIEYEETGPLVELMGFGTQPPNPLVLDIDDYFSINDKLEALDFTADILMNDERSHSTVQYDVHVPLVSARDLVEGDAAMDFELEAATAFRQDGLQQELLVDTWTLDYADRVGALNGEVDFRVIGGHFDWWGRFTYVNSGYPDQEVGCLPE